MTVCLYTVCLYTRTYSQTLCVHMHTHTLYDCMSLYIVCMTVCLYIVCLYSLYIVYIVCTDVHTHTHKVLRTRKPVLGSGWIICVSELAFFGLFILSTGGSDDDYSAVVEWVASRVPLIFFFPCTARWARLRLLSSGWMVCLACGHDHLDVWCTQARHFRWAPFCHW